jgi:uncharacterized repeat protein (TIGR01451 family)
MMRFAPLRPALRAAALLAAAALAGTAATRSVAQTQAVPTTRPPVTLTVQAEKLIVAADGSAGLATATSVEPGDTLLYTVSFMNATDGALDHVRITQSIPPGVVYVPETAVAPGAAVLFSVDGGATFGLPAELVVTGADGARRAADPSDYTHVRWLLAARLEPHTTGFARFRAELR